jgi:hypothetical protein
MMLREQGGWGFEAEERTKWMNGLIGRPLALLSLLLCELPNFHPWFGFLPVLQKFLHSPTQFASPMSSLLLPPSSILDPPPQSLCTAVSNGWRNSLLICNYRINSTPHSPIHFHFVVSFIPNPKNPIAQKAIGWMRSSNGRWLKRGVWLNFMDLGIRGDDQHVMNNTLDLEPINFHIKSSSMCVNPWTQARGY